ncbi:MAG: diaminopropionate ammonia-lyase [Pseudomonadota bacterium]
MSALVEIISNGAAAARDEPPPAGVDNLLSPGAFATARREIASWSGYQPTPLVALDALASRLGLAQLHYKDESRRFGLGSFKALGGAYAVLRVLQRTLVRYGITEAITAADLANGAHRAVVSEITFTSATDGNHGRSVAWGARLFGCRAVIFIHETVSEGRRDAIAAFGADVVRTPGNYDASVRHAFAEASQHGWHVVQDTATATYQEIPADITQGYGVIADEIAAQVSAPPTHVIVQTGVGGLAGAICLRFWQTWAHRRPKFIVLEPTQAACVAASLGAGSRVDITGDTETIMAGLACGEVSLLAWEVLATGADGAIVIDDDWARIGVRQLANPIGDDPPVVGGECSGGAVGALLALNARPNLAATLELNAASRVVIIGTEGATDPAIYRSIVGRSAEEVMAMG